MPNLTIPCPRRLVFALILACSLPANGLLAGDNVDSVQAGKDKNPIEAALDEGTPLDTLDIEGSYVGASGFTTKKFSGAGASTQVPYKDQAEIESEIQYGHRFHLEGRVYLKLGVDYQRFDFGETTAPIPSSLQQLSGVVALEYVVHGQAAAFINVKPGIYSSDFNHVGTGNFDAPTAIGTILPVFKSFYVLVGARWSLLAKYPVFPIAGAVWLINDHLRVEAVPPEPRIIYSVSKKLDFFAGGELLGEAYKRNVNPAARPQDQRFNGAVIDYSEERAGAGLTYSPCSAVDVDLSGGWDFGRDFDYYRGDSTKQFKTNGAPYAKMSISAEF